MTGVFTHRGDGRTLAGGGDGFTEWRRRAARRGLVQEGGVGAHAEVPDAASLVGARSGSRGEGGRIDSDGRRRTAETSVGSDARVRTKRGFSQEGRCITCGVRTQMAGLRSGGGRKPVAALEPEPSLRARSRDA